MANRLTSRLSATAHADSTARSATYVTTRAPAPPNCAYVFETGASAWLGSIHTEVDTAQPSRSAPPSHPSAKTKMARPTQTDNQSSVIQGLGSAVLGQCADSAATVMFLSPPVFLLSYHR